MRRGDIDILCPFLKEMYEKKIEALCHVLHTRLREQGIAMKVNR